MAKQRLQLSEQTLRGLYFLHKYRFLTIAQFSRVTGYSQYHAGELLRGLTLHKAVNFIGFEPTGGHGKTPKVYYPELKAWHYLMLESRYDPGELGEFVPMSPDLTWTPEMFHRLKIIDCFLALELAVTRYEQLEIVKTLLSYRRVPKTLSRETTDTIDGIRIVPDGVCILRNHETGNSGLFFLEVDMGTERLTAPKSRDQRSTIKGKFELYDQYLQSGRFAATYQEYADFRSFLLLFVTTSWERIENIRLTSRSLNQRFHSYYRLATFTETNEDFLGKIWASRSPSDTMRYALIQQPRS